MKIQPQDKYKSLMSVIRWRFDHINTIKASGLDVFFSAETAAFHGRKIVEGIAFGCLVVLEQGIKNVPRDAEGQWNAETIFRSLQKKKLDAFPSPSLIRTPSEEEVRENGRLGATIEKKLDSVLSINEMCAIYNRVHCWAHEINPYVCANRLEFISKHGNALWSDLASLEKFIERHVISIKGEMFYCTLRCSSDGNTKVMSLSKTSQ
jgi:hypothetical protein